MGACATKPKDLKGEAPETAPENIPAVEVAAKDVVVVAEEEVKKEVDGGAADDGDTEKRRSLSNLFKGKEINGSEQVKDEASQTTQASEPSKAKPEVAKVVDAPVTIETEKALEVVSTAEAPKVETSEEKKLEELKSETKISAEKKVEEVTPAVKTPAEKKVEEVTPAVETTAEKKLEEALGAAVAPKSEVPVVTKAEEKPAAEAEKTVVEEKKSSSFSW